MDNVFTAPQGKVYKAKTDTEGNYATELWLGVNDTIDNYELIDKPVDETKEIDKPTEEASEV